MSSTTSGNPSASGLDAGIVVLANHGVDRGELSAATDRLRELAAVEVVVTRGAQDCRSALARADGRRVVVAGGDGTLTGIVGLLRRRHELAGTTVGLLPLGTGNDFARTLGIPLDPTAAAEIAAGSATRRLDILIDDGDTVVVNAVHAGIGADAATAGQPYKDLLGAAAYPVGAALTGGAFEPTPTRVDVDGDTVFDGPLIMVAVGNGRTVGGGTPLLPEAQPDDGLLDVMVVATTTMRGKLTFAAALRAGTHLEHDDVRRWQGRVVALHGGPLRHSADGEVSAPRASATYRVEADALTMAAPPR